MTTALRPENTGLYNDNAAPAIVSAIASVVPSSYWAFARISVGGSLGPIFASESAQNGTALLDEEYRRMRLKAATGPQISATGTAGSTSSGITLLFADARLHYGILTLHRTAELGPFTSPEISILTLALDAVTEHLSNLRLQPTVWDTKEPVVARRASLPLESEGAFYVLDDDFRIALAWSAGVGLQPGQRLPTIIEHTVRDLTSSWSDVGQREPGIARPVPFLVVRTHPMSGLSGLSTGVRIKRFHQPNSLTAMAARYHISPREIQVLSLLLDGDRLYQIARSLYITSSTVQDHVKSMLDKTESRNRSELIARVLGWQFRQETMTA